MASLTPDQAILIRNIVLAMAFLIIWGISILTAYNLAGSTGSFAAFLLGPIGVLIAYALRSDEKSRAARQARIQSIPLETRNAAQLNAMALETGMDLQASLAGLGEAGLDTPGLAAAVEAEGVAQAVAGAGLTSRQEEMLRRILAHEVIQTGYLKDIHRAANWFYYTSVIAAILGLIFFCGGLLLNASF